MCLSTKDIIELTFSGILVLTTIVYATLTWLLVCESKKQRKAQTEPLIIMGLQTNKIYPNLIELYIENLGFGIAYNINFKFTKDFVYKKQNDRKLSEIAFLKNGIKTLSSKKKHQIYLTSLLEDLQEKIQNPIEIEITYDTLTQKNVSLSFVLDFSEFEGLLYVDIKDKTDLLIKAIEDLGKK